MFLLPFAKRLLRRSILSSSTLEGGGGTVSRLRYRIDFCYVPRVHEEGRPYRSCSFSSGNPAFHRGPQYPTPPVSFLPVSPASLRLIPGFVRDMNSAYTYLYSRHRYFHKPVKGINDLASSSRGSSALTYEFSGENAEDSLDVPSPIPPLISSGPKYSWLLPGPPLCLAVMLDRD